MYYIKAQIIRLIDNSSYPEVVLCEFTDLNGRKHEIIEKWPVLTADEFDSKFPKTGYLGCVVAEEKTESYIVSTEIPWSIETTEGKTIFEISKDLLIEKEH